MDNMLLISIDFILVLICLAAVYALVMSRLNAIDQKITKIEHSTPLLPIGICKRADTLVGTCPACIVTVTDASDQCECKWCHQKLRWPERDNRA